MAKRGSKEPTDVSTAGGDALKHNPFAALAAQREALPQAPSAPADAARAPLETKAKSRGRLILRRETKHRGGKPVIVVRGFAELASFAAADVEQLAKQLKTKLGCGGTVEHEGELQIVLQGNQPAKVAELLREQGFRVDGVTS